MEKQCKEQATREFFYSCCALTHISASDTAQPTCTAATQNLRHIHAFSRPQYVLLHKLSHPSVWCAQQQQQPDDEWAGAAGKKDPLNNLFLASRAQRWYAEAHSRPHSGSLISFLCVTRNCNLSEIRYIFRKYSWQQLWST